MRYLATIFLALALSHPAHAQLEYCRQILSDGIWDIRSGSSTANYQRSFVNWFCSQNFSSETSFKEKGGSLKIPIEELPVEVSGASKSKDWKSYYSSACSLQDEFISQLNKSSFFSKTANGEVIKAWESCVGSSNLGLKMTYRTTSTPSVFQVTLSYKSNRKPADSATLSTLAIYQATKEGLIKPVSCTSIAAPFNSETGKTTNVDVPDNGDVSFTCQRNVCSTAFIEVAANVQVLPDNKIEIQPSTDSASGCSPPLIPNCVKYNVSRDRCYRCEFDLDERGAQFNFQDRTCTNMPEGKPVKITFSGGYRVANRGAGGDCWLAERMKAADGSSPDRKDHTNVVSCSVDVTRQADFAVPKDKGQANGGIQVEQCQWGGNANMQCDLKGKLSIFTAEGE
jgi:hypothetical protein